MPWLSPELPCRLISQCGHPRGEAQLVRRSACTIYYDVYLVKAHRVHTVCTHSLSLIHVYIHHLKFLLEIVVKFFGYTVYFCMYMYLLWSSLPQADLHYV